MTTAGEVRPLTATAWLELGAGLPMLLAPGLAAELLQVSLSPTARVLILLFGAAICGLGALAWVARGADPAPRRRAGWVFAGYHVAAAVILAYALGTHTLGGVLAAGAALAHLVLAGVLARALTADR
jgi:hypothetical protein